MSGPEIAALISSILDIDDIAIDDNFFEIGGNSLLALRLIEGLAQRYGVRFSLLDVIRAPTAGELALLADSGRATETR